MEEKNKKNQAAEDKKNQKPASEEWATEVLEELDDFIELQGIYIRQ